MQHIKRPCAVCGGTDSRLIYRQHFASLSAGSFISGYDVVACEGCGFAYADGIPAQSEFDAHYRDMSKYEHEETGGKECEYDTSKFLKLATILQRVAPARQQRILDIGCSTGRLLSMLREAGFEKVTGLDPSPACATAARRLYNIDVITATLANFEPADGSFDVAILSGVLEHICDLAAVLAKLRRMVSENGLVLISVPDATRFACDEDAPFQQFSTEHINFFSAGSLTNLMKVSGFSPVVCQLNDDVDGTGYTYVGPVIDAVFKKSATPPEWQRDETAERALDEYVRKSQTVDDSIHGTINHILSAGEPIIVWGVGTHTLRLLSTDRLSDAPIAAFVDSNPRYQGKELNGVPIIAPAELVGRSEPILVSSRVFQKDIVHQIRESLGLQNELHLLYNL